MDMVFRPRVRPPLVVLLLPVMLPLQLEGLLLVLLLLTNAAAAAAADVRLRMQQVVATRRSPRLKANVIHPAPEPPVRVDVCGGGGGMRSIEN